MTGFLRTPSRLQLSSAGALRGRRPGRAVVAIAVLVALVAPASAASSATDEPAVVGLSVSSMSFWPAPEDGGQSLTVSFTAPATGEYEIRLMGDSGDYLLKEFGTLEPGPYSWTWDGRTRKGELFVRQRVRMEVYSWRDNDHWADIVDVPLVVNRSFDSDWISDNTGEANTGHVDLEKFTLTTDRRGVHSRFEFLPGYSKSTLFAAHAYLDVDKLNRGYIATLRRKNSNLKGKLVVSLQLAQLYSDAGRPKTIRCPGMKATHEKRSLTLSVPRKCFKEGGDAVRAGAFISDVHNHADGFPDYDDDYRWTNWVVYDSPPS